MMKGAKLLLLFITLSLFASPAYAPFVELTYTEFAKALWTSFAEIAKARELSPSQAKDAEVVAATWIYLGPCRGTDKKFNRGGTDLILSANPTRPLDAAILEMIAMMMLPTLGREPGADLCRFALETAEPTRQIP